MFVNLVKIFSVVLLLGNINALDIEEQPPPKPSPYVFSYNAGRYPGHVDRAHTEVSDGSGTVRGSFSYIDPRQEVRTVQYIANEHGFYPALSHPTPADTAAVINARNNHYKLYKQIAQEHASQRLAPVEESHPHDTEAVINAKVKHLTLFEKIAAEHAQIAAEREAERLAAEAANPNHLENDYQNHSF